MLKVASTVSPSPKKKGDKQGRKGAPKKKSKSGSVVKATLKSPPNKAVSKTFNGIYAMTHRKWRMAFFSFRTVTKSVKNVYAVPLRYAFEELISSTSVENAEQVTGINCFVKQRCPQGGMNTPLKISPAGNSHVVMGCKFFKPDQPMTSALLEAAGETFTKWVNTQIPQITWKYGMSLYKYMGVTPICEAKHKPRLIDYVIASDAIPAFGEAFETDDHSVYKEKRGFIVRKTDCVDFDSLLKQYVQKRIVAFDGLDDGSDIDFIDSSDEDESNDEGDEDDDEDDDDE